MYHLCLVASIMDSISRSYSSINSPAEEAGRGVVPPHRHVSYWCLGLHHTRLHLSKAPHVEKPVIQTDHRGPLSISYFGNCMCGFPASIVSGSGERGNPSFVNVM